MDPQAHTRSELESYYEFLRRYAPLNARVLLDANNSDVIRLRKDVLLKARLLSFSDLFDTTSPQSYEHLSHKEVLSTEEIFPPTVSPQLLQQSANLFKFLHQNVNEFATATINSYGTPTFSYLINHAIPCLFGFFSSKEHIETSQPFYVWVSENAIPKIAMEILEPCFRTCCFSFVESISLPFLKRFTIEKKFWSKDEFVKNKTIELFANELAKFIIDSVAFLPRMQIVILKIINEQWGKKLLIEFLFETIIKKMLTLFLKTASHEQHEKPLDAIFNNLCKNKKLTDEIIKAIFSQKRPFQIPSMFLVFDHKYHEYIVTILDIQALLQTYTASYNNLPVTLQHLFIETTPLSSIFLIRVFEACGDRLQNLPNIVFENREISLKPNHDFERIWLSFQAKAEEQNKDTLDFIKSSHFSLPNGFLDYAFVRSIQVLIGNAMSFEKLLSHLAYMKSIRNWNEILLEYQRIALSPFALLQMRIKTKNIEDAFTKLPKIFSNPQIRQLQYLSLIAYNIPNLLASQRNNFAQAKAAWLDFIDSKTNKVHILDIHFSHPTSNKAFHECIQQMGSLDKENLISSFQILQRVITSISDLAKYEKVKMPLLKLVICYSRSESIPKLYIILNRLAFRSHEFMKTCTEDQLKNWLTFESTFLGILVEDQKLCRMLLQMQESLLRN
ncbi:hypothetical protein GPJ56_001356 [Histomonas meleagridis]|uniref:uncharacterized protein n=1 Tax=Histomonas meleagridis TaxID=135588 RepID=UPI00355A3CBF|nr:hypothetical protein GPJ56_001356 [Histomonas meleagridis]KAH0805112.1 hypothetical protein GO595_002057 [Histomonas meleagridis]